jgi:hypothetical protein
MPRYRKRAQILKALKSFHTKRKRDEIIREVFESDSEEKDPAKTYYNLILQCDKSCCYSLTAVSIYLKNAL